MKMGTWWRMPVELVSWKNEKTVESEEGQLGLEKKKE